MLAAIRQAVLYVKAGNQIERKEYENALSSLDKMIQVMGERAKLPKYYEMDIRRLQASSFSGNQSLAAEILADVLVKISKSKLEKDERNYLSTYCLTFVDKNPFVEINSEFDPKSIYLGNVRSRFSREYPLIIN